MKNNHNKFYIVQVLQPKGKTGPGNTAYVYIRYGRVGVDGVKSESGMDYARAEREYYKTVRAKMRKGYTEIKMAKGAGGEKGAQTKAQV